MEKKNGSLVRMFWIKTLSPLHVGTGRGVDYIDLPIAREKVSNWPFVPGSGIKGVVSDFYGADADSRKKQAILRAAFGYASGTEKKDDTANAGALVFTDAHLLCLPIQSLFGTFAWCTSPLALARFVRDRSYGGLKDDAPEIPDVKEKEARTAGKTALISSSAENDRKIYLQDLDIEVVDCEKTQVWGKYMAERLFPGDDEWQERFVERFVILPENMFSYFCEMGTQVDARIRIKPESKTVQDGALWYEESLPCESILAGFVWCEGVFHKRDEYTAQYLMNTYCAAEEEKIFQMGGKASVGRGRVVMTFEKNED